MKKIIKYFVACLIMAFYFAAINYYLGIFGTMAIGFGKEVYDSEMGKEFSWWNMLADTAGMIVGVLLFALYKGKPII